MNHRARMLATLNYEPCDRLPLVLFGYWTETLEKWAAEGHITREELGGFRPGSKYEASIAKRLGFDFDYDSLFVPSLHLDPPFEVRVIEELPGGGRKVLDGNGVIVLEHPGAQGIPTEIDHLLKGRAEWEEHFLPRLQFDPERVTGAPVRVEHTLIPLGEGGLETLRREDRESPVGLYCGSLFGNIRNMLGLVGVSLLPANDEALFDEIVNTIGELCYRGVEATLETGAHFDYAHFWEDIACKNGPLVLPSVFEEKIGPHYKRITDLLRRHGVNIISVDCDGCIDALVPIWLKSGVNTMFPIEVGTWQASIAPWRERYGRELRGIGGMDKKVFAYDRAAIDAEVERLRPLVELGGYIPCPDHRIPPDAKWENVQYYCDRMREVFG